MGSTILANLSSFSERDGDVLIRNPGWRIKNEMIAKEVKEWPALTWGRCSHRGAYNVKHTWCKDKIL